VFFPAPQTLHVSLCKSITSLVYLGILLDKCFLEVSSFLAFPLCIRLILIRKGKTSYIFYLLRKAFLLGKTGASVLVHSWGCVFQTALLRIQFRAISLLH